MRTTEFVQASWPSPYRTVYLLLAYLLLGDRGLAEDLVRRRADPV